MYIKCLFKVKSLKYTKVDSYSNKGWKVYLISASKFEEKLPGGPR